MDICLESFNYTNSNVVNEGKIGSIVSRIKSALLALLDKIKAAFAKIREKLDKRRNSEENNAKTNTSSENKTSAHKPEVTKSNGNDTEETKSKQAHAEPEAKTNDNENKDDTPKQTHTTPEEEKLLANMPTYMGDGDNNVFTHTDAAKRKYVKIMRNTSESEIRKHMDDYLKNMTIELCLPIEKMEYFHDHYEDISKDVISIISAVCAIVSGNASQSVIDGHVSTLIKIASNYSDSKITTLNDAENALDKFNESNKAEYSYDDIRDNKLTKIIYDYGFSKGIDTMKYCDNDIPYYIKSPKVTRMADELDEAINKCKKSVESIREQITDNACADFIKDNYVCLHGIATDALILLRRAHTCTLFYYDISNALEKAWKNTLCEIYKEKEDSIKEESFNFCTIR